MPHTHGPWTLLKSRSINGAHIYSENARAIVARLTAKADKPIDQKESDGYLIAAAPELLQALKHAVKDCPCSLKERDSGHRVECFAPGALEAIAKAEGRNA